MSNLSWAAINLYRITAASGDIKCDKVWLVWRGCRRCIVFYGGESDIPIFYNKNHDGEVTY